VLAESDMEGADPRDGLDEDELLREVVDFAAFGAAAFGATAAGVGATVAVGGVTTGSGIGIALGALLAASLIVPVEELASATTVGEASGAGAFATGVLSV
jgi:hypothetical protein